MEQRTSGRLPVELNRFIGRQRELDALRRVAGESRLLTLTGAGGSGKSRLALQFVRTLGDAPDVVWAELAPLSDEALVPTAVLRALGAPAEGGAATADTIAGVIRDHPLLLVLDNCEHVVDTCAELVHAVLQRCESLRILATSREALGVTGERAWLVPPLELPDPAASVTALAQSDAVQLFIDRARDVVPDFELTPANAADVGAICTRLDGIPLAVELAAARVRHMTPRQIHQRLDDAFALLTSTARTAMPRHRTLRAAIEWSHDLVPEPGRVVLRRLSVFRGGFTLDMVEDVAAGDGIERSDVLDLVTRLADRSILFVREHDGEARYHMLETMRQYASQKLDDANEAERVRARLADAVYALVAEVEPSLTTTARRSAFARLEPELDNIREVLPWTREHRPDQHVRMVGSLWWFWFSSRHWVEAHDWLTGALALPAAQARTVERGKLLFAAGALGALRAHSEEARPLLEEATAIAAETNDGRLGAYAHNYIAMTWGASLSPRTVEYAERAEAWFRAHDDAYGLRLALLLGGMGLHGAGRSEEACARMEEAVRIARRFGQDRELAVALQTYSTVLIGIGRVNEVAPLLRESLYALQRDPSFLFIARAIDYFAYSRAEQDPRTAARMLGIATAMRRHIGANRFAHDEMRMQHLVDMLRARLGDAYDQAFAEGMTVPPGEAIDRVLGDAHDGAVESTREGFASAPERLATEHAAGARSVDDTDAAPSIATARTWPGTDADLIVRVLGTFDVIVDGKPVEGWTYGKPRELLALLLLSPGGLTRAEVGQALWPDAAPARVRNSFHVTLHHLRKALRRADRVILAEERYRIAPEVSIAFDATTFERRARRALADTEASPTALEATRAALALYQGPFLAGESAGVWRDEVQDRLRRLRCDLGLRLATALEGAGELQEALGEYERVIAEEPLHEPAHRGLMRTLAASGQRAHALRGYERLRTTLEGLELTPEPQTLELLERIRGGGVLNA